MGPFRRPLGVNVDQRFKTLSWLTALDRAGEHWRPDFLPNDGGRAARITTKAPIEDETAEHRPPRPSSKLGVEVTAQTCQRVFDEMRKQHPEALYEELSELAAKQLAISGRRLRKLVPNPFR